ncbi:MAG: hypothetical protein MI702_01490 [Chlorobiales bacterium]|nr:hypothetical protein [Chlorobiales bacterium]
MRKLLLIALLIFASFTLSAEIWLSLSYGEGAGARVESGGDTNDEYEDVEYLGLNFTFFPVNAIDLGLYIDLSALEADNYYSGLQKDKGFGSLVIGPVVKSDIGFLDTYFALGLKITSVNEESYNTSNESFYLGVAGDLGVNLNLSSLFFLKAGLQLSVEGLVSDSPLYQEADDMTYITALPYFGAGINL